MIRTGEVKSGTVADEQRVPREHGIPFAEAVRTWARIAALSFGGPAGQIAVMHRILVEEKHWIGEARFLHALNYCMLLPGPEAQQLAIYIGWLMHHAWIPRLYCASRCSNSALILCHGSMNATFFSSSSSALSLLPTGISLAASIAAFQANSSATFCQCAIFQTNHPL